MKIINFIVTFLLVSFLVILLSTYYKILVYGSVEEYCNGEYIKTGRCTLFICDKKLLDDSTKCKPCLVDTKCSCERKYEFRCSSKFLN